MQNPDADRGVSMSAGMLECALRPYLGGAIARFDRVSAEGRQHLMRPASEDADDVLAMASFPLVPFANRIRNGQFECDGRVITLTPNLAGDPSPLHGQGWRGRWSVDSHGDTAARMRFAHRADEWPWDYEAWQEFALDPDGLSVTLFCRNLSAEAMPCALALHPYFPCDPATVVDIDVDGVWTTDALTLPVARVPATERYDLRARHICGTGLDHGFDGWRGAAQIRWGDRPAALAMSSPDADYFQIYSPDSDYFAAEPVQNANAALNASQHLWPGLGIVMLGEGEERRLRVRFDVIAAA